MIQLYSSTSDQTEHARSPEHSAVMILTDLREQMAACNSHMYVSRTTTSQYRNKLVAFKKEEIDNTFGEYLAAKGIKTQLRTC